MKLTPPKTITFWIAVILGVIGILAVLGVFSILGAGKDVYFLIAGFVLLVLANLLKDL